MTDTIAIIDYGMGNLRSVAKALEKVGGVVSVTRDPKVIANAGKIVLPGVGAFGDCMSNLENFGLIDPVVSAIRSGKSFLGICLGLQLLFDEGEEFGRHQGLGVIPGKVVKFKLKDPALKIPHMGWNQIAQQKKNPLFAGIDNDSAFYFVHSYVIVPKNKEVIAATTNYGGDFVSAVALDNIFACQFHPEKSQANGLTLLKNFVAS